MGSLWGYRDQVKECAEGGSPRLSWLAATGCLVLGGEAISGLSFPDCALVVNHSQPPSGFFWCPKLK